MPSKSIQKEEITIHKIPVVLIILVLLIGFPGNVFALSSNDQVEVQFPSFNIHLNGVLVNQINNKYPLICYHDITYFPLTWHGSRFMGIETSWSENSGLTIRNGEQTSGYSCDDSCINDLSGRDYALPCPFPITINSKSINNSSEPYPFLEFRGITYLPLTWKYAVGDFGWNYSWNDREGLTILKDSAKENLDENLFTIINNTAFSKNYHFSCQADMGDEKSIIEGNVENRFTQEENGDLKFASTIIPANPVPFTKGLSIEWWAWTFDAGDSGEPLGPTIQAEGVTRENQQLTSTFQDTPLSRLNLFQISKEKRKAVQTVKSLPPLKGESEKLARYKITFLPGTEWANRTIEVSIDNEKGIVEEITDTCQESPESSSYNLHIAISNVIKR